MTTIAVARKGSVISIAADTQSTYGDTRMSARYDRLHDKIFTCGDSHIAICGSAAHDLVLQHALRKLKAPRLHSRSEIFETFRKLHPKLKEDFFLNPKEEDDDPYESSQMTVLIANRAGIFGVFSMREVYEYDRFWAIGSGREFAIGAMWGAYEQHDSAADIARIGVLAGVEFDINSSLPITQYQIEAQP